MKIYQGVNVFWWALLALANHSLETSAFSTVSHLPRHGGAATRLHPRHAATLDGVDEHIRTALEEPSPREDEEDDDDDDAWPENVTSKHFDFEQTSSFPELEEYTDILLNKKDYPVGSLPKEVVSSASRILFQWSKAETVEGAQMVDQLVKRFEEEGDQILNNQHYTLAVSAWVKSGDKKIAGIKAEEVLNKMQKIQATNPFAAPTRKTFSMVAEAHGRALQPDKAEKIIRQMEEKPATRPSFRDYSMLLTSFARYGDARKAEQVLKRMVDLCKETGSNEYAPDLYVYHRVLDSWALSNERIAGQRATQILEGLHALAEQGEWALQPDERTYTAVITAVVRSKKEDRVQHAQDLFDQALARGITPDVYTYAAVMQAYASTGDVGKCQEILKLQEEQGMANVVTYNSVIKALTSSTAPDAVERAEEVLERLISLDLANKISYTSVMAAYARRGDLKSAQKADDLLQRMHELHAKGNESVRPNVQTYNTVLNSWIQCGEVLRAEEILNEMEEADQVNVVSYTTLMHGWWKSKNEEAPERAERLFERMTKMYKSGNKAARPNHVTYVNLINAIARSRQQDAPERAEKILFDMYEQYKEGNTDGKPNTRLVGIVMDCWQKSGRNNAGERAEALLDWLSTIYEETGGDPDFQPNEFICSSSISAWSKSRCFGKAERARGVLQKMKAMFESGTMASPPNTHCYTAVINSCAYCLDDPAEKKNALAIALATYKELERTPSHGTPNHVTYASVMSALNNLLAPSEKRTAALESVFRRCCTTGQVDDLVLRRLQGSTTSAELKRILSSEGKNVVGSDGRIYAELIPSKWQRNIQR